MKPKPTVTLTRLESEAQTLESRRRELAADLDAARLEVNRLKHGMGQRILGGAKAQDVADELADAERRLAVIEAGHGAATAALDAATSALREESERQHLQAALDAAEAFAAKQKDLRTVSAALQAALGDLGAIRDELAGHTSGFNLSNPRWGQANAAQMGIDFRLRKLRKVAGELADFAAVA